MIFSNLNDRVVRCFHHNDPDGLCSAKSIIDKYPNTIMKSMDYNKNSKIDLSTINSNDKIFIVDFSIDPLEMEKLLNITQDVTWIDHHKSSIEKYKDFKYNIKGLRYIGESGCALTYSYINKMDEGKIPFNLDMINDIPKYMQLINDWDIWRFKYGDDTRYFQIAFNINFKDFSNLNDWNSIDNNIDKYLSEGKCISKFINDWSSKYCKNFGFEVELDGYKCFAMNVGYCNSTYFNSVKELHYDILIPFAFNGNNWTLSLYSENEDIDVSKVAMKYGGGGHKNASGCTMDTETITKLFFNNKKEGN